MKRPPRLTKRSARRLATLRARQNKLEADWYRVADELARSTLSVMEEEGATLNEIAEALEVGTSTVHGWTERARVLRKQEGESS
jgi:DNA-directed RNA polymerase specialized sigma24 family protein